MSEPAPALPDWLAAMFPVARHMLTLPSGPDAGRRIHYVDEGDATAAPAIVLLHGNPTWSFLWRKVIAALPGHRCLAADMLGLGLSDKLPRESDHTVARHADALAQWLRSLSVERFVLVGQDWGGPMAAAIGARLPERVAGVVLANTSVLVPKRSRGTLFHRFARLPVLPTILFRGLGVPQNVLWSVQGDRHSIRGQVARAYRWPLRRRADRIAPLALARMVPSGPDHPSLAELERGQAWITGFGGPMALVWGRRDPILGRALRRHREAFPAARVTETDAGHFLQEQVPDALAAAITDVAQRAGVGTAPASERD
jgi:haloalkane dehalogenase